ncbi:unnamed protein product [Rodentolepis nana]|uniref:P66_CC domain-containing protein n=1 Tax=Rodentolepis nana TaxID=102285 RepID=A0A158QH49_RODNA|nr:unnamed protein product [Rodentolepis nana]
MFRGGVIKRNSLLTVLKESPEEQIPMCSPPKRIKTGTDALDLSQKPSDTPKKAFDVIVLSEDDDEKATPVGSDTEKENAPGETNGTDWKSVVISLENELRQEEAVLSLLHKLKDSQNPNNSNNSSTTLKQSPNSQSTALPNHNVATSTPKTTPATQTPQRPPSASQTPKVVQASAPQSSSPLSTPQISRQQAVQALEQTCLSKKAALRKQLDRNLEKVNLPRPPPGSGLSEVSFIPSTAPGDFTSLLGLEEVVKAIQDFDISNIGKASEPLAKFKPFLCVKCGTDYTPVWKREKPDSTNVVCEGCIGNSQRMSLKNEYDDAVDNIMQQHCAAEREIDKEYQDIVSDPAKLDAYIKEQEKKLLTTQQLQIAQQAAYNQRFGTKTSTTATPSGLHQSPSTIIGGTSVAAAAHQRSRVATAAAATGGNVVAAAAATQMALQYAKAMNVQGANSANAALMMSALANSQAAQAQQQQVAAALQQQQQRLLAAQLLQSLQHATQQQHQQVVAPATAEQNAAAAGTLNQLQALLVSNILGGAGGVQNASARTQLFQTMQYLLMQHQQQQHQAQQAAAAQAAAAQQNVALQHLFAQIQSNPSYANFFQQLWPGGGGGAAANNSNQSGANKK